MVEKTEYAPGTPSWVDLGTPDVAASATFYGGLFGWDLLETGTIEETGGYCMFTLRGKNVCGVGPLMGEGQPPAWTTYFTVDDADKTAELVSSAGGQVVVAPMDVMDVGRMAAFIDPTGAFCSIWQPGTHPGAALVNEPNTLCWNELNTRDVDTAKEFYSSVFGVTTHTSDMEGMTYTEVKVADASIAGIMAMPEQVPAQVPAHWLSYFAVEDTDATVAKAESLGASVMMPPTDIPPGRFAVLTDPHGAAFAVIKMNPMP